MATTPRRHPASAITAASRRSMEAVARPWRVHQRGSNGDATRAGKVRSLTPMSLDTLADPQPPAFAAADAILRALADVGRNPVGVVGKQAARIVDWLRQSGHDAQVLPLPGKKARNKRGSHPKHVSAIVAVDCIAPGGSGDGLKQIRQMVPSDGRLIAVVPNATHASVRLAMLLGQHPAFSRNAAAQHGVVAADAERLLHEAGFTVTGVERQVDSVDALNKAGAAVPDAILRMLADDAEAMTSHFAFVAEPGGAASAARLVNRRLSELADEQRAVVIQAARLTDRVADLEVRVRHWNSETERIVESLPASEMVATLEARLQQLAANQSELASAAAHTSTAIDRIDVLTRALDERESAAAKRNAALREARDRCLERSEEVAALARRIEHARYRKLIRTLRRIVQQLTPPGSTIAVVSRGDVELLTFDGRQGWHFPQTGQGVYAGHHPADSAAAISHVDEVRARGARYLLFPRTALWWLDYYKDFHQHLLRGGRCLGRDERWGALFALGGRGRTR